MPPKKKGKKGPVLIDGVNTSAMSREQLEGFAHRLKAEMDREREERNFFQLERDKLRTFWEITRDQLEEAQATIRNKNREVEMAQELADIDIKNVTQQMKHLQYENQSKICELRAEAMTQLKIAQEEHDKREQELLKDIRELKRLLREKEEITELQIQELKMKHSEMIREQQERYEKEAEDLTALHEQKLKQQAEELGIKNRMEMSEVEERKNTQISKLIESHESSFNELKSYYNDITVNNLALITTLKEQMEELRKQSERNERVANETIIENKRLTEPLAEAQAELIELRRKLLNYGRDQKQLARLKKRHSSAEKHVTNLKWESDVILMRNEVLVEEREHLKNKFEEALMELQQKTGLKNVLLERKITLLEKEAEAREALLSEAIAASGMEPSKVSARIDDLLKAKQETIDDLKYELARVCKAHDDLLATYERKLQQYGIPQEELGFQPLRTTTNIRVGSGPAGLVTKNR
ncbi:dynein regulatory complex subunit 4 isoform X2 [Condylostylus longicornis]|nr:dynein regulatory complex subunit 4 isoform X2 [Condylostylus longicornis]